MLSYYQQVEQPLFYLVVIKLNLSIQIEVQLKIKREKVILKITHQIINLQELQPQHKRHLRPQLFQPIKEIQTNQLETNQPQTINNHLHYHHHHHQIVVFVTYLILNQVYRFIHLC